MTWKHRTISLTANPSPEDLDEAARRLIAEGRLVAKAAPDNDVFREQAALRLSEMAQQLETLRQGTLLFESTDETWRAAYESVLSACKQGRYLSSGLIGAEDYWRDRPGRVSLAFNYRLVTHGFHVSRVLIIDDLFWPGLAKLPDKQLLAGARDQGANGCLFLSHEHLRSSLSYG